MGRKAAALADHRLLASGTFYLDDRDALIAACDSRGAFRVHPPDLCSASSSSTAGTYCGVGKPRAWRLSPSSRWSSSKRGKTPTTRARRRHAGAGGVRRDRVRTPRVGLDRRRRPHPGRPAVASAASTPAAGSGDPADGCQRGDGRLPVSASIPESTPAPTGFVIGGHLGDARDDVNEAVGVLSSRPRGALQGRRPEPVTGRAGSRLPIRLRGSSSSQAPILVPSAAVGAPLLSLASTSPSPQAPR